MPLSVYTPFPAGGAQPVTPADLSEVFLKSYTVSSGVSSITISDALFKLSQYKTIHVRFNNLTTTGATNARFDGGMFRNDAIVSGTYTGSFEGITSTTATGYTTNSFAPSSIASFVGSMPMSASGTNFAQGIQQLDIYLTRSGMTFEYHLSNNTNSRRFRGTVQYPDAPLTISSNDYFGVIIGFGSGTFTGGTVSVFGVQ